MYRSLPVVKATSAKAGYRLGNFRTNGNRTIPPRIAADSLLLTCWSGQESFAFYTDRDSLAFAVKPGPVKSFYVLLNNSSYALTVVRGLKPALAPLAFDAKAKAADRQVWYEQNRQNACLLRLLAGYPLQSLVANPRTDTDKAWPLRTGWEDSTLGNNELRRSNTISILEEAKECKLFCCVEYGIVAAACLNAVGPGKRQRQQPQLKSG